MSRQMTTTCDGCGDAIELPGGYRVFIGPTTGGVDATGEGLDFHGADCLIRWVQESRKLS